MTKQNASRVRARRPCRRATSVARWRSSMSLTCWWPHTNAAARTGELNRNAHGRRPMADLPLMCQPPNKRPTVITEAMAQVAADKIAAELLAHEPELGPANEVAADIVKVAGRNLHMDGYEIARDLER